MKWSLVLAGFAVPLFVAWSVVQGEWGNEMKAVSARGEVSELYAHEPFYPPEDATASATLAAARAVWEHAVETAVREGATLEEGEAVAIQEEAPAPSEASLREQWPALASLDDQEERILSLYVPVRGRPVYPLTARLDQGVVVAVNSLWEQLDERQRAVELKAMSRFKIDQVVGGYRVIPEDGGYGGVALDEGLDGIRLRHSQYPDFHYLPSWSIEHKIDRKGIHGRARRFARDLAGWKKSPTKDAEFHAFRTRSWVEAAHGGGPAIGVARGNTDPGDVTPELLRERIRLAAGYLTRETGPHGEMTYGYEVEDDKEGTGYNLLRHAGTGYSMLQAYRLHPDPDLLAAAERSVDYFREKMKEDKDHPGEWFVLDGKSAKLGGVGLGLCMMVEMDKASPGYVDMDIVVGMAKHIERMQLPSGEFLSFYDWRGKGVTNRKSIYYSGEALLGLLRVYELTGDEHWLDVAEKGADFLVEKRWVSMGLRLYVPLDAWLIQALEELDRYRPSEKRAWYAFELSEAIARRKMMDPTLTPPDMVGAGVAGITSLPHAATAGAFGEALSAAARLEARHRPGETRHRDFAMKNAAFQVRNQFTEANSWHVPNPEKALGAFRERPDDSQTRNDHVQHNLSGLFGLLDLLDPSAPDIGEVVFDRAGGTP